MGHIDPATGRNRRESGKLARRLARAGVSGAIRRSAGKPAEKRIDQKRRNRVYPPGERR